MKKVLLVEDEPAILSLLSKTLKKIGLNVISCEDGEEALRQFEVNKPELVVTDIIMPKINGIELIQQLRAKHGQSFKVIIVTNIDNPQDEETGQGLNISDYILKSEIALHSLQQKVATALMTD